MARVKLEMPPGLLFNISIQVRISDINYGNHLGHDALISILQEARMQWLAKYHYTELEIEDAGLIMADIEVEYKAESFFNDLLDISLFVGDIGATNFDIFYEVKNQDKKLIAKAKTGMICYNYALKKITKIPIPLLHILNKTS